VRSPRAISTKSRFRIIVRERQFSLSLSTLRSRPWQIWTRFYARVTRYRATAKSIHPLKIISSRGKNTTEACRMVLWRRFCSQLRSFARFRLHFSDSNSQKSLRETGLALCVYHRFGSTKTDPCNNKDEIFFRARARVRPDAKDTFFLSKETLTGTLLTSPIFADTSLVVPQRRPGPRRRESSQRRRYSDVHHQLGARGVS
jgi:hypothetical protein